MKEHLSPDLLEGVRERTLPVEPLLAAMMHLDQCAECRGRLARPETVKPVLEQIRTRLWREEEDHLSYEQMEELLDGKAGQVEREIAEEHLRMCARCDAEYRDLEPLAKRTQRPAPIRMRWTYPSVAVAAIAALLLLFWIPRIPAPGPASQPDLLSGIVLPPQYQAVVGRALAENRIAFPPLPAALIAAAGTLRGEPAQDTKFKLLEPLGVIVLSDRPRFRWRPLAEGARYVVSIYDLDLKRVAQSEATQATEWSPPQPLPRGGMYQWQVGAELGGRREVVPAPPAPEARFQILDGATARELEQARSTYPNAPLVLAVLYAQAGLRLDAQRELDALVTAYPQSSVARQLQKSARESSR